MEITIQKAKNGEETACAGGHFLHSNYAPVKEAERFAENLQLPYTPSSIILTEPGLSYTAEALRKRFPHTKIGAIRYSKAFEKYNSKFDFVLNYFEHPDFEAYLEGCLNEEELLTAFFTPWPAASTIFVDEDKKTWASIKEALNRAKTLLITRQYFEKKWFLNSCHFLKNAKAFIGFDGLQDRDILIISSGPSLIPFLPLIIENRKKFFILCLSSAISACLKNQISPDLCMTSDGGYWAGQHLKALYKNDIPLAMPSEAYCPKAILSKLSVLALDYGDGPSSQLISASKIPAKKALRNGTVSGTALLFAAQYFTKNIYLCGLDMACQKGFQHTQPNQLEYNSSIKDNRISTKALRLTRSELTNVSLNIYKNWFINNPLNLQNRKVYRLIEEKDRKNSLGWIKDLNTKGFNNQIKNFSEQEAFSFKTEAFDTGLINTGNLFSDSAKITQWKKQLFPLDYVQLSHNPSNKEVEEKINKEWESLKSRAEKILL